MELLSFLMESLFFLIDFIIHLDAHLGEIIANYGGWTYLILFLIIFCETGLVVTPILPGDSLLFIVGALSASGALNLGSVILLLLIAAVLGDTVNYHIGKYLGMKLFNQRKIPFLKEEYLIRTHAFYERHGGKTIILARFVPIIRTFAPFVAGMSNMRYVRFTSYNIVGAVLWIIIFILGGYFFGNIPMVQDNFTFVIFGIIFISFLPGVITSIQNKAKGHGKRAKE